MFQSIFVVLRILFRAGSESPRSSGARQAGAPLSQGRGDPAKRAGEGLPAGSAGLKGVRTLPEMLSRYEFAGSFDVRIV